MKLLRYFERDNVLRHFTGLVRHRIVLFLLIRRYGIIRAFIVVKIYFGLKRFMYYMVFDIIKNVLLLVLERLYVLLSLDF